MKTYFLKATGSACYDSRGISFPKRIKWNFKDLLRTMGAKEIKWKHHSPNWPAVLTFKATELQARNVQVTIAHLPLIVLEET